MKKFIISLIMLAASAAVFAEVRSMKYVYNGEKCTVWFTDSRHEYFDLAEIADYATPYQFDRNYDYELLSCDTFTVENGLFVKLLQDLCRKYNYITAIVDSDESWVCEAFMLNTREEICIREWRATAK